MNNLTNIDFSNPQALYLLLLLIPLIAWYIYRQGSATPYLSYSNVSQLKNAPVTWKNYLRHILFVLRVLAISLLIVVLARPQTSESWENSQSRGLNIMLALDVSSSMLAEDFNPNRLEASKNIATQFISGRRNDRMGLVVFAGESFTQCPLTTDHAVLINYFNEVKSGLLEDGTAIGVGLANAVNRLKNIDSPSKIIILLTDGENNKGEISPADAAKIAETYNIRVYTIGVGSRGTAPYPVQTPFGKQYKNVKVNIDEDVLKEIANTTGGEYFRATNNKKLKQIYTDINEMERSKIEVKKYSQKHEKFMPFALLALVVIGLEILLKHTILRNIP